MPKKYVEANYNDGRHTVKVGVTLISWSDNNVFFQYSPELDMTGYGNSEREAADSFNHILEDFITYTLNKGIIFDELERLGWTTNKKKKRIVAPGEEQLLQDNETYKDLLGVPGMQRSKQDLALTL